MAILHREHKSFQWLIDIRRLSGSHFQRRQAPTQLPSQTPANVNTGIAAQAKKSTAQLTTIAMKMDVVDQ
jgi:hypothetical protein